MKHHYIILSYLVYLAKLEHADRVLAGRHMHISEFAQLVRKLNNQHIIITHTTQRTPMSQIRKILKDEVPVDIYDRMVLLMDKRRK
jgi:ribonuclease BN (tRNA processing enzyme)